MKASPVHATGALPHVVGSLKNGDVVVRRYAVQAVTELVKASPVHATEALPHVVEALNDESRCNRRLAIKTVLKLLKTAPHQLTGTLPRVVVAALKDNDELFRCYALSSIENLVDGAMDNAQ